jgi:hypothetical protein
VRRRRRSAAAGAGGEMSTVRGGADAFWRWRRRK